MPPACINLTNIEVTILKTAHIVNKKLILEMLCGKFIKYLPETSSNIILQWH